VQFVIRHDKQKRFLFASLQSAAGKKALTDIQQQTGKTPDSLLLFYKGKYYIKSSAVLKTAGLLGGMFGLLAIGYIFPAFLRNAIYDIVAKNRYRWFGKKDECMIPTPELKSRFLD
jgi:predicted DCC family thiol-disulfide oxidoreductase YuxK